MKVKKEQRKFFQDIFLAFMMGVFFWSFNALFIPYANLVSKIFYYPGEIVVYSMAASSLLMVVFFCLWKFPWLVHLKKKDSLEYSFKIFFRLSAFFTLLLFFSLLINSISYQHVIQINNSLNLTLPK